MMSASARNSLRTAVFGAILLQFGLWPIAPAAVSPVITPMTATSASYDEIKELLKAERYGDAEEQARASMVQLEAKAADESLQFAEALDLLAEALWRGGKARAPETLEIADRAIAMRERLLATDHPAVAPSLVRLGRIRRLRGEYEEAMSAYQRALNLQRESPGPESFEVGVTLRNMGAVLRAQGAYEESRQHYEDALAIIEKADPTNELEIAKVMNNLGNVLHNLARSGEAEELLSRVVLILETHLGPRHPEVAMVLNNLALVMLETGDHARARPLLERSLEIRKEVLGPDHIDVAQSLSNLAKLLLETGEEATATRMVKQALEIASRKLGPEHPGVAMAQHNMGHLLVIAGQHDEARKMLGRALATREKVFGPANIFVADTLISISDLERSVGDLKAARSLSERALKIQEASLGPVHLRVAFTVWNLGTLHEQNGDLAGARQLYERALSISEEILGKRHPRVARILSDLARVHWKAGDSDMAVSRALAAEATAREHLQRTARVLSEREALGFVSARASGRDVVLTVLATGTASDADKQRIWSQLVLSRALVLDEVAGRHRASHAHQTTEVRKRAQSLERARARLATLLVRGPRPTETEGHLALLQEAQEEVESAERALSNLSRSFQEGMSRRRIGAADVSRSLPAGSALVSFHAFQRLAPGDTPTAGPLAQLNLGVRSYLALVLRPGGSVPAVVPLGSAQEIDDRITAWRRQVAIAPSVLPGAAPPAEAEYRQAGEALRAAVWDPVSRHFGRAELVIIVPDGALHLVNMATLPAADGGYLVETGPNVHVVSAERDLVPRTGAETLGSGLLALGDPDFDADPGAVGSREEDAQVATIAATLRGATSACLEIADITFSPLPEARAEVEEIASLFRRSARESEAVTVLVGREAQESRFRSLAPGHRVLHLATHGFLAQESCAEEVSDPGWAPFLISGIGLAGANVKTATDSPDAGDDGVLTALEVSSLDLGGVQWAVLSACETGAGPVYQGEGLLGLRRAFETAGARTLIMSLWGVQDAATRDWMVALYRGHGEGLTTADAVRRASLEILQDRRKDGRTTHPFYWGAFVAAGDWR